MLRRADIGSVPASDSTSSVVVKFAISEPWRYEDATVLAVQGELDLASAPRLKKPLDEALRDPGGGSGVVLDMSDVTFLDSTAFRVLMEVRRRRDRTPLAIVCRSRNVLRVFTIAGFDRAFDVFPTLDQAISYLREEASPRS